MHFTVYLAITREQRAQGLSFVSDLPQDQGMLFVFPQSQRINMWMKDTPRSLDLLFADKQGKITEIVKDTLPNSTTLITSQEEAYAVLEINAGTAQQLAINTGDHIHHPLLGKR